MCASVSSRAPTKARSGVVLAAAALLSACATQPPSEDLPDISTWDARRDVLSNLESWAFNGRIAVRNSVDGFNGKLRYRQEAGDFEAVMSGPLGIGTVVLEGEGDELRFTDKHGQVTRFEDPEADLARRYGWQVPLDSLRFWALGIPDPSQPATTSLNDAGRLDTLEQGGWSVVVSRYREAAGQVMPGRLTAKNGATRVTLVIDRWAFP
jgi:outer membrane lipoprotein LolB